MHVKTEAINVSMIIFFCSNLGFSHKSVTRVSHLFGLTIRQLFSLLLGEKSGAVFHPQATECSA